MDFIQTQFGEKVEDEMNIESKEKIMRTVLLNE
jgi:hypothetical protein